LTEVETLPDVDDPLLNLTTEEWTQHKAKFVRQLYDKGNEYPDWSKDRADWWFKSLTFFVNEFILAPVEGMDDQAEKLPMPDFHRQWYWWRVSEQNYLNLAPRDHAKTSVHAVFSTVWEICVNRNIRFFIVFSTTDVAKLVLAEIKSQLTQNPLIRQGFGIFNPAELDPSERTVDQDWSQHSITVNRPGFGIKDPTVAVAGALTNVLSRRADRLLVDDLLTDAIAHSEAKSMALERWYANDVQPVLIRGGQETITGTLYRKGDFYHKIIDLGKDKGGIYRVFIGDAILDEEAKTVLWPERWSFDDLAIQRVKLGYVHFNRNYRNRIVSDADSVFPMIWFTGGLEENTGIVYRGCYDPKLALGMGPKLPGRGRWLQYIVMGVDPAIGYSEDASYFALVVLGINFKNEIVVADMWRGHIGFVQQKRIIAQKYYLWKPRHVIVESNAYQKALAEGMQESYPEIPIKPYYTSGQKLPPDIGVPAMDVYFETGRFRIPRGTPQSVELTDILVEELHYWGVHEHSDTAMALWFGFQRIVDKLERMGALPPTENLIFGDRLRWENRKIQGLAGGLLPAGAQAEIARAAIAAPLSNFSPVTGRGVGLFSSRFTGKRRKVGDVWH
jgi:hypothetical protein